MVAILCDTKSTLHSYAILVIHAEFYLPKTKFSFMVNFFMYFFIISRNNQLKNISNKILKVDCTNK
jgi:hypothetical protein